MTKNQKLIAAAAALYVVVSLWSIHSLKGEVRDLQSQLSNNVDFLHSTISRTNATLSSVRAEIENQLEQNASLLSQYDTAVSYSDGKLAVTVSVAPKERRIGEQVFLTVGGQKQQAHTADGLRYESTFVLEPVQSLRPSVSFESLTGVRQEILPEVYLDETLSLRYFSQWGDPRASEEDILYLSVYSNSEQSDPNILEQLGTPTLVILSSDGETELGRLPMELEGNLQEGFKPDGKNFSADLSSYRSQELAWTARLELATEGGIAYREDIATFERQKDGYSSGSGDGMLYPVW